MAAGSSARGAVPSIERLDRLPPDACAGTLAPLFEGAPRFLARLCAARPFGDAETLIARARAIAHALPEVEQVELLDAHPRLGAPPTSVSALSFREQGYDEEAGEAVRAAWPGRAHLAPELERAILPADLERAHLAAELERLNAAYEARFAFRYCVFVAGRSRAALLPGFEASLGADRGAELRRALDAVVDIAEDRWRRLSGE